MSSILANFVWFHVKFPIKIKLSSTVLRIFRESTMEKLISKISGKAKAKVSQYKNVDEWEFSVEAFCRISKSKCFPDPDWKVSKSWALEVHTVFRTFSFSKAESLSSVFRYFSSTSNVQKQKEKYLCQEKLFLASKMGIFL